MWNNIKELFASKKFKVMFAAVITLIASGIAGEQEWGMVIKENILIVMTYIAAQGAADIGKEKARVEKVE